MTMHSFKDAMDKAEKHPSIVGLNNIEAIMGSGIRTAAVAATAARMAIDAELEILRKSFHNAGIWVKPRYGKYKGRPSWVESALLSGAGVGSGIYLEIRIPSLRDKNTPIDDRNNCHVYLKDVDFVKPVYSSLPDGNFAVHATVDHYSNNGRVLTHTTGIELNLREFLR